VLEAVGGSVRRIVAGASARSGDTPEMLGRAVAEQLRAAGADAMLAAARAMHRDTPRAEERG
jgi:hypothetical protein